MSTESTVAEWAEQVEAVRRRSQANGAQPGVSHPAQLQGKTGLQIMQAMLAGELPYPHIMQTLDYSLVQVEKGRAVFQGVPQLMHYNPLGSVHGGWYATLLDSALGCAVHTMLEAGQGYTTAELGINIVRAASMNERPTARHRHRHPLRSPTGHRRSAHRRRRRQAVCARHDHLPGVRGHRALIELQPITESPRRRATAASWEPSGPVPWPSSG